jgi:hypothetical protein
VNVGLARLLYAGNRPRQFHSPCGLRKR